MAERKFFQSLRDRFLPRDERVRRHWENVELLRQSLEVVYEDADMLVVNKPPGVITYRSSELYPIGVQEVVSEAYGETIRAANRLDIDTSGALVFARTSQAHTQLRDQFSGRRGTIEKRYFAVAQGDFPTELTVELPLKNGNSIAYVAPDPTAPGVRVATSIFRPIARFEAPMDPVPATLLDVQIVTGLKHQIRVSAQELGHPLLGDGQYGDQAARVRAPRQALHASEVVLEQPTTGLPVRAFAPVPDDIREVLSGMRCSALDGERSPIL